MGPGRSTRAPIFSTQHELPQPRPVTPACKARARSCTRPASLAKAFVQATWTVIAEGYSMQAAAVTGHADIGPEEEMPSPSNFNRPPKASINPRFNQVMPKACCRRCPLQETSATFPAQASPVQGMPRCQYAIRHGHAREFFQTPEQAPG
ncbi:hypothetical protein WJX74_000994 [Apatococcus lobatus]|uniref:Uncharacterized protein n=2 Tax=Apatococcus TaxID=904362 RepID=A0AAW1SCA4_9CHLO